jgi:hypothetical protein
MTPRTVRIGDDGEAFSMRDNFTRTDPNRRAHSIAERRSLCPACRKPIQPGARTVFGRYFDSFVHQRCEFIQPKRREVKHHA